MSEIYEARREIPKPMLIPLDTETMEINMGPHHPSMHGIIRLIVKVDGEFIVSADVDVGFLHRGIEKIAEEVSYYQFMPYTDRIDYLAATNCNIGYALTVEEMAGIEVPKRAQYLRVISAELVRIASHLIAVGTYAMDIGAVTPFPYALREREYINDLMEIMTGARLTYNYARIGGVSRDVDDNFFKKLEEFLDHFEPIIDEYNRLFSFNKILIERTANIGVITKEEAISYSLVGPNLRASGVKWDLRKDEPYLVYDELDFDVPVGTGMFGTVGDSFDRYWVRIEEMRQSCRILRQCISKIPDGPIQAKVPRRLVLPKGEIYVRTEAPRGELGYYLVSDGKRDRAYRLKIRTGSYTAMSILQDKLPGMMIADVIAFFGSLDVVVPEIDR
jgi:NADH-quinone oxidoreductase subunit D